MPIAAFTSDGLIAAAAISINASSSRSRAIRKIDSCGFTEPASGAFACKRNTRASTLVRAAVAAAIFIRSGCLAGARGLRGQPEHLARLGRSRDLPAELLDNVAGFLDHLRIRLGEHAFRNLHAVFKTDAHMAAGNIRQCHAVETPAPDAESGELRVARQKPARVNHRLRCCLESILHAKHERDEM